MFTLVFDLAAFLRPVGHNLSLEWLLNTDLETLITDLIAAFNMTLQASKRPVKFILTGTLQQNSMIRIPITPSQDRIISVETLTAVVKEHLQKSTKKTPYLHACFTQAFIPLQDLEKSAKNSMVFLTSCPKNAAFFEDRALGRALLLDLSYPLDSAHRAQALQAVQKAKGFSTCFLDVDGTLLPSTFVSQDCTQVHTNKHLVSFCQEIRRTATKAEFVICTARPELATVVQINLVKECKEHLKRLELEAPKHFFGTLEQKCLFTDVHKPAELQRQINLFYADWAPALSKLVRKLKPTHTKTLAVIHEEIRKKRNNIVASADVLMGGHASTPAICDKFTKEAGIKIGLDKSIFTAGKIDKAEYVLHVLERLKPIERPQVIIMCDDQQVQLDRFRQRQARFEKLGVRVCCVKVIIPGEHDRELLQQAIKYIRQTATSDLTPGKKTRYSLSEEPHEEFESSPSSQPLQVSN